MNKLIELITSGGNRNTDVIKPLLAKLLVHANSSNSHDLSQITIKNLDRQTFNSLLRARIIVDNSSEYSCQTIIAKAIYNFETGSLKYLLVQDSIALLSSIL